MPGGQRVADVADLLAHLVERVRHAAPAARVLEREEHQRLARLRVAAHPVDVRHFLQLALDAVGDLLLDLARRRARPVRLDHHHLERERRILRLPELLVGEHARQREDDDQVEHERAVVQRPLGQVEARARGAPAADEDSSADRAVARRGVSASAARRRRRRGRSVGGARAAFVRPHHLARRAACARRRRRSTRRCATPEVTTTPSSRYWPIVTGAQRDLAASPDRRPTPPACRPG